MLALDDLRLPTGQNIIENRVSSIKYHAAIIQQLKLHKM